MARSIHLQISYGKHVNHMVLLAIASLPIASAIKLNSVDGDIPIRRTEDDLVAREDQTVHITNFTQTLKEALEQSPAIALTFEIGDGGCVNHFYHMILNAALPLYAKLVRPFVQEGRRPPHRKLYLNSMGGAIDTLQEIFPEFEFAFVPWVPQCCQSKENGTVVRTCASRPAGSDENLREIPWFSLNSDGLALGGARNSHSPDFRELVHDFRNHILDKAKASGPEPQGPLKHVYVSRREQSTFTASIGHAQSGCEQRCLDEGAEQDLIRAMNDTAAGVQVAYLSGLPFFSQVRIHREASLLVAVHGAAFVHCLWMPSVGNIIEIGPVDKPYYFKWLCHDIMNLGRHFYQAQGDWNDLLVNASDFTAKYHDILQ